MRTVFWDGQRKKKENPRFKVRIEPAGPGVFVGQHGFPPPALKAYREAVADDEMGENLEGALAAVGRAGEYSIGGEHYKRVPRGYDAGHRRAELLKYNGLYAQSGQILPDVITTPEFVELCFEHCRSMAPLQQWLVGVAKRFEV